MAKSRESVLSLLDEIDSSASATPTEVPTVAKTREDLIAMLDAGEARILPPKRKDHGRGTGVDVTPLPEPSPTPDLRPTGPIGFKPDNMSGQPLEPSDFEKKAAASGIITDKPAPVGHALASLAINDAERVKAYQMALTQHFGRPVEVEVGPETGQLEYLDPETGRFATIGSSAGSVAGGSLVMVPELAGGALAAFVTKSPVATSMAGAAGAVIGEIARIEAGRAMGINIGATPSDVATAALKVGGTSAATGVAFDKALQVAQFFRNAIKGDAVGFAKDAERLGVDPEEAAAVQAQMNDMLEAERMRIAGRNAELPTELQSPVPSERRVAITLGEASGSPELLAMQDEIKRSRAYQAKFGEFDAERQRAMRDFYDLIGQPFSRNIISDTQTLDRTREAAATQLDYAQKRANEHVARWEAEAALAIDSVDTVPSWSLGEVARDVGAQETQLFRNRAEQMASQIREVSGDARFIENTHLSRTLGALDDETREIIFADIRNRRRQARSIPSRTILGPEGEAIEHPLFDPDTRWSFSQSWSTLSELKRTLREKSTGAVTEGPDVGALQQMIRAMETDLYNATNNSEIGPMYRDFIRWYRREKRRLDEGVVGHVLKREGGPAGRFTIGDREVFNHVFPEASTRAGAGVRQTQEFMELIKHDPQAVQGFRQAIADDWRQSVVDPSTGRVSPERHQEWLRKHEAQLSLKFPGLAPEERALSDSGVMEIARPQSTGEPLFTANERRALNRGVGVEKAFQAREQARDEALARINRSFNAELTSLDNMGQLMNLLRKDLDGGKASDLVRTLKNPGTLDVLRGVRHAYLKDMNTRVLRQRIASTQEKIVSPSRLDEFINGGSGRGERGQIQVVRELFGNEYASNLVTLNQALQATARETRFPNRSNTAFWQVGKILTRMKFGVISRESLAIGGAQRLYRTASDTVMAKAIMNPADMKRLMQIWKTDVRSRKAAVILGQLGVSAQDFGVEPEK